MSGSVSVATGSASTRARCPEHPRGIGNEIQRACALPISHPTPLAIWGTEISFTQVLWTVGLFVIRPSSKGFQFHDLRISLPYSAKVCDLPQRKISPSISPWVGRSVKLTSTFLKDLIV